MSLVPKASYVDWCPGNGTRYALHFSLFPNGLFDQAGPAIMIQPTVAPAGMAYKVHRVMLLGAKHTQCVSLSSVMASTLLNETNAVPVTIMIAAVLGIEAIIPDEAMVEFASCGAITPFTFAEGPVL